MKCFFYLLFATSFLLACKNKENKPSPVDISTLAKIAADTNNYTQIKWIDSIYNFGTIEEGAQIQVQFKFQNIGNKPLYLTEVKAGCGCTTPDYTKEAIEPNKEGWVKGVFNSQNQNGEVHKYINVTTNTTNGQTHKLMFTGIVNKKQ